MRKALVAAVIFIAVVVPYSTAQAAGTATVHFVHAFGNAPTDNSVDLWVNGTYFSTFAYGSISSSLQLPTGATSTLLVCSATASPPATATNCPAAATLFGTTATGFSVVVPASPTAPIYEVMAPGSNSALPAVAGVRAFTPDLACNNSGTARFQVVDAAPTPGIDVLLDSTKVISNLTVNLFDGVTVTAGSKTVSYRTTGTSTDLVTPAAKNLVVNTNTISFFTGYQANVDTLLHGVIYTDEPIPSNCVVPTSSTTTSTIAPTTSTTAVVAVAVTPRFTG